MVHIAQSSGQPIRLHTDHLLPSRPLLSQVTATTNQPVARPPENSSNTSQAHAHFIVDQTKLLHSFHIQRNPQGLQHPSPPSSGGIPPLASNRQIPKPNLSPERCASHLFTFLAFTVVPAILITTEYTLGPADALSDVYCGGTISVGKSRSYKVTIGGGFKLSDFIELKTEVSEEVSTSSTWSKRPDRSCDCAHVCYRQAYVYGKAKVETKCCSQTNIGAFVMDPNATDANVVGKVQSTANLTTHQSLARSNHTSRRLVTQCQTDTKTVDYKIPRKIDNLYDLCFDYKAKNCGDGRNPG